MYFYEHLWITCIRVVYILYAAIQVYTGIYRYIQVYTGIYRYIQVYTGIYRYIQVYTGIYRYIQVYTGIYRYIQVYTGIYRQIIYIDYRHVYMYIRILQIFKSPGWLIIIVCYTIQSILDLWTIHGAFFKWVIPKSPWVSILSHAHPWLGWFLGVHPILGNLQIDMHMYIYTWCFPHFSSIDTAHAFVLQADLSRALQIDGRDAELLYRPELYGERGKIREKYGKLGKLWETVGKILGKHGEILENKVLENPWMKWMTLFSEPIGIDCRRGITRYAQKHYAESIADLKAALAQAREPWHPRHHHGTVISCSWIMLDPGEAGHSAGPGGWSWGRGVLPSGSSPQYLWDLWGQWFSCGTWKICGQVSPMPTWASTCWLRPQMASVNDSDDSDIPQRHRSRELRNILRFPLCEAVASQTFYCTKLLWASPGSSRLRPSHQPHTRRQAPLFAWALGPQTVTASAAMALWPLHHPCNWWLVMAVCRRKEPADRWRAGELKLLIGYIQLWILLSIFNTRSHQIWRGSLSLIPKNFQACNRRQILTESQRDISCVPRHKRALDDFSKVIDMQPTNARAMLGHLRSLSAGWGHKVKTVKTQELQNSWIWVLCSCAPYFFFVAGLWTVPRAIRLPW